MLPARLAHRLVQASAKKAAAKPAAKPAVKKPAAAKPAKAKVGAASLLTNRLLCPPPPLVCGPSWLPRACHEGSACSRCAGIHTGLRLSTWDEEAAPVVERGLPRWLPPASVVTRQAVRWHPAPVAMPP